MDNSHTILLNYYQKYRNDNHNLVGGIPWYYYFWPGNWFSSVKSSSSLLTNVDDRGYNNDDDDVTYHTNPLINRTKEIKKSKKINLPSLVKLDVRLYNPYSKGGISDDIFPIIENEYNLGKSNFKNVDSNLDINIDFTIVKIMDKILYGAGTFTAVYKIKDNNLSINDPNVKDNIYILRLVTQDENTHMYDNPKIHKEYDLFNKYLPRIYYYGNFNTSNHTYYYTITKLYNDFSIIDNKVMIPKILSNTDKFVFLYNNIVMLNDLSKYNYTHFDYKITNIGFEIENNKINVILIDYDESTLQELTLDNKNFYLDRNNNVTRIVNTSMTHVPEWLSKEDNPKPYIFDYHLPVSKFDKFAVVGLLYMIIKLDIKFKVDTLSLSDLPSFKILTNNYRFNNYIKLINLSKNDVLRLSYENYDLVPTYKLLLEIFSPIVNDKKKYLF